MEKQEYIAIPIKTWQELSTYLGMQPFASARPIVQILESTCLPPHMVTIHTPETPVPIDTSVADDQSGATG